MRMHIYVHHVHLGNEMKKKKGTFSNVRETERMIAECHVTVSIDFPIGRVSLADGAIALMLRHWRHRDMTHTLELSLNLLIPI